MLAKFEVMPESEASKHLKMKNAGWIDFLGWAQKPASILIQKMLAKFEIMLECDASKHVIWKMLAGWAGWQVFVDQPALVVLKCWLD